MIFLSNRRTFANIIFIWTWASLYSFFTKRAPLCCMSLARNLIILYRYDFFSVIYFIHRFKELQWLYFFDKFLSIWNINYLSNNMKQYCSMNFMFHLYYIFFQSQLLIGEAKRSISWLTKHIPNFMWDVLNTLYNFEQTEIKHFYITPLLNLKLLGAFKEVIDPTETIQYYLLIGCKIRVTHQNLSVRQR